MPQKKICIVGNKRVPEDEKDHGAFIDSCDIVVRISKMCNISFANGEYSGKVGSKIDYLVLEANYHWNSVPHKNLELALQAKKVFIKDKWYDTHYDRLVNHYGFDAKRLIRLGEEYCQKTQYWTTAASTLRLIHELHEDAHLLVCCMDIENRQSYVSSIPWHNQSKECAYINDMYREEVIEPLFNC